MKGHETGKRFKWGKGRGGSRKNEWDEWHAWEWIMAEWEKQKCLCLCWEAYQEEGRRVEEETADLPLSS